MSGNNANTIKVRVMQFNRITLTLPSYGTKMKRLPAAFVFIVACSLQCMSADGHFNPLKTDKITAVTSQLLSPALSDKFLNIAPVKRIASKKIIALMTFLSSHPEKISFIPPIVLTKLLEQLTSDKLLLNAIPQPVLANFMSLIPSLTLPPQTDPCLPSIVPLPPVNPCPPPIVPLPPVNPCPPPIVPSAPTLPPPTIPPQIICDPPVPVPPTPTVPVPPPAIVPSIPILPPPTIPPQIIYDPPVPVPPTPTVPVPPPAIVPKPIEPCPPPAVPSPPPILPPPAVPSPPPILPPPAVPSPPPVLTPPAVISPPPGIIEPPYVHVPVPTPPKIICTLPPIFCPPPRNIIPKPHKIEIFKPFLKPIPFPKLPKLSDIKSFFSSIFCGPGIAVPTPNNIIAPTVFTPPPQEIPANDESPSPISKTLEAIIKCLQESVPGSVEFPQVKLGGGDKEQIINKPIIPVTTSDKSKIFILLPSGSIADPSAPPAIALPPPASTITHDLFPKLGPIKKIKYNIKEHLEKIIDLKSATGHTIPIPKIQLPNHPAVPC